MTPRRPGFAEADSSRNGRGARRDRPVIYPVFLPHAGCPFQCIYCDQTSITGAKDASRGIDVPEIRGRVADFARQSIEKGRPGEIAFFGGTFTGLAPGPLRSLLDAACRYAGEGAFSGIRFSTRPDQMGGEVLELLRPYPVKTVELGVQSLDDSVLASTRRGYTSREVLAAVSSIRAMDWSFGLQFMPGLPGDDRSRFLNSIREGLAMGPAFLRIYPTLVLEGTPLADWHRRGVYRPLELGEAISWCADALELCRNAGVPVARMGLPNDLELEREGKVLAGPRHPAFGHLVRCRWWRDRIDREITRDRDTSRERSTLTIRVPSAALSEATGHAHENIESWRQGRSISTIHVTPEPTFAPWRFSLEWD